MNRAKSIDVVGEPRGKWIAVRERTRALLALAAVAIDSYRGRVVFRRPGGTVISKRVFLRMFPRVLAAISADGRTTAPAGVYPSPWSR
jgi:hypothetical protein